MTFVALHHEENRQAAFDKNKSKSRRPFQPKTLETSLNPKPRAHLSRTGQALPDLNACFRTCPTAWHFLLCLISFSR